jgi:iron complex outermembrane receptor protein
MKKILLFILVCFVSFFVYGQEVDSLHYNIDEVSVVSLFKGGETSTSEFNKKALVAFNYGQDPSGIFIKNPSIISLNDNGTEFGYGYFRIRGLDQTRINVMLDGCPWNEAEDFGSYFANSPDLMSSMENITVNRGTSSNNNGIAGSAGSVNLESINIWHNNESYIYFGCGSYNSYKSSIGYNMAPIKGWGLHVKVTHQQTDGYRDYGFNNSKAFTIKTGYKFNDKHSIDILSMNGYHKNGQGWIGNTLEELTNNPQANGCTSLEDDNWFMTMNRLQYKGRITNNIILTSSIYYQYQTGSYRFDLDNYMTKMIDNTWESTGIVYDYALTHNLLGANVISKMYFNNLSLSAGLNGYGYNRRHYSGDKGVYVNDNEYYDNTGYKTDFNTFVILTYSPISKLSITGNMQYRYVKFDYKDNCDNNFSYNSKAYNTIWNFINWGIDINYTPIINLKLYAKYNCVNREPTRSDMFGGNEYFTGEIATIIPEVANDFEFGTTYKNKKINANINIYYMWFNNELILNGELGINGLPCHENAKKSFRTGVEGSLNWNIWKNLYFDFNASYSCNKVLSNTFGKNNHILTPNIINYTAKKDSK